MAFRSLEGSLVEPLQTTVLFTGAPNCLTACVRRCEGYQYRITNRNIEMKKGVFMKNIDNVELWRVKDIRFIQTGFDGCCATGTAILYTEESAEFQEPEYRIFGIPQSVYEKLKEVVEQNRVGTVMKRTSISTTPVNTDDIMSEDTLGSLAPGEPQKME